MDGSLGRMTDEGLVADRRQQLRLLTKTGAAPGCQ
jgi:hypothetical protein